MEKGKRALITGGCGFLGRHFARYLGERGWDIVLVDDLSTGLHPNQWPPHLKTQATFIQADLREYLKKEQGSYDLAIHLAAVVGGRAVMEGKPAMNAHSLELDALFFRWAAQYQPGQVVYMSSPAAYPITLQDEEQEIVALKEEIVDFKNPHASFGTPDLIYGWSKLTGEFLASTFARHYGLNVFCPRPFSGYGEDQNMSYPVPAICQRAVHKEDPLTIWGSGKQSRDFIYVGDIVEAIISYLPNLKGYETMNLGSGKATTFREVAAMAADIVGYRPEVTNLQEKPEGVKTRVADISKMKQYYTPRVPLREGLTKVVEFLQQ